MKRVIFPVIFLAAFAVPAFAQAPAQPSLQTMQIQDQLNDTTAQLRLTQQAQANASAEFIAERVTTLKLQNQLGQVSQAASDKDKQIADKDKEIADLKGQISSAAKSEKAAVGEPPAPAPAPAPDGVMKGTIVPPPAK